MSAGSIGDETAAGVERSNRPGLHRVTAAATIGISPRRLRRDFAPPSAAPRTNCNKPVTVNYFRRRVACIPMAAGNDKPTSIRPIVRHLAPIHFTS